MNHRTKLTAVVTLALLATSASSASAFPIGKKKQPAPVTPESVRLTPAQSALVDKAIAREAVVIKTLKLRQPLVETYIQNMRPDPVVGQTPASDLHFLGRVDFGKVIGDTAYQSNVAGKGAPAGKFAGLKHPFSFVNTLSSNLHLTFHESGFVQMLLVDSNDFNRTTYTFAFLRNEFLGTIPTVVFDVEPSKKNTFGRFAGRIWVERNGGNIVRFNGSFSGSEKDSKEFFHFDSWRINVPDDLWLPASVYIEESDAKSATHTLSFKAINYIWGYALKAPPKDADLTSLQVENATDESQNSNDVSPLEAEHAWIQQAEDNVVERLFTAGLIDAPSPFDEILTALANNILIYNKIETASPIKVRTLLTEPLETASFGNTILVSKGLLDTAAVPTADGAQLEGNLDAILSFQLAHVILGHHVDTKFAFSDRLLFPPEAAFVRLPMHHTDADNAEAAKRAMELLNATEVAEKAKFFGLYLQQLQDRSKALKALNQSQLGDGLMKPDGTFWMQGMVAKAPKLDTKDLKQVGAMPLGSLLKFDPWTDQVIQMHAPVIPLLSARDKLPFEITPVIMKLTYWAPPTPPAPPAPAAAPAASPAPPAATTSSAAQPTGPQK
jgi:hypothetical protein